MARVFCAFAAAHPLLAARPSASTPTAFAPRRLPAPAAPTPTPKRPRRATPPPRHQTTTPRAQFNWNDPKNARFRNQTADLLLSAGRFFQSSSGQVVLWGGLVWLVVTGRIGVLFDSFLILFAFLTVVPVVAMLAFRWWVSRQLVEGQCSNCGAPVTGLKGQTVQCTSCGTTVTPEKSGDFSVKDPSSATIDIDARQVDDY